MELVEYCYLWLFVSLRVALIAHQHAVVVESSMIPLVMFRLLIFLHRIVLIAEPV